MQNRALLWAVSLVMINTGTSFADEPNKDCFSITTPPAVAGGQGIITTFGLATVNGSILINRCTGQTWVLAKAAAGKGAYTYRWYPILSGNEEAQFSEPRTSAQQ
jgi:hypothetical protein